MHGERRSVATLAAGFLAVLHHGMQDEFQVLPGEAVVWLAAAQGLALPAYRLAVVGTQQVIDRSDVDDPVAERLLGGQVVLDLAVVVELALAQVDGEPLARSEATLLDDVLLVDAHHAVLRSGKPQAIAGDE